jgi:hypothetical protein
MIHLVGQSRNGAEVHVNLVKSNAAKSIAQQPQLLSLVAEALQQRTVRGASVTIEHDMGCDIGYDVVVETTAADVIFYAQMVRYPVVTRFTKTGKPDATRYLTFTLQRNDDDTAYDLHEIWIGRLRPPKPGHPDATEQSNAYWKDHAVAFNGQLLQPRTISKECPY